MKGEPIKSGRGGAAATQPSKTTRDRSVEPIDEPDRDSSERDDLGENR